MKLSQIQVHEVSLVDKAANKRKFLLFKRDGEKPKPEEVLKAAGEAFDQLAELMKARGDGAHNETPNYAQQAKDLLTARWPGLVSFYTDEELTALFQKAKAPPPADDKTAKKDDELELSPEEMKQLESLDAAVTSLQQQLAPAK